MRRWIGFGGAWLRQFRADLLASFWLRPAAMTLVAVALAQALVSLEGAIELPDPIAGWVYAGGKDGARDLLGAIATASIGVAGTTFSITVAALTLASSQMGPRLLRNFTRDPGNQYALGAFLATFAYALTALRTVRGDADGNEFVPQLAVSVALLLGFACIGVLMWFLHHVANSINVTHVVALVHHDLSAAVERLPKRDADAPVPSVEADFVGVDLRAPAGGYLRVLNDAGLAERAAEAGAELRLQVRPGDFVFPCSVVGAVAPASARAAAEGWLAETMSLGASRNIEQDIEFAVRQLVEVALRALSPSLNDPFTAIAVLDRFGATLCELAGRDLPDGRFFHEGTLRLQRPTTDYAGLVDAMFHMIRQDGAASPPVMIRLLEMLAAVGAVERDAARRGALHRHAALAGEAALAGTTDRAARMDIAARLRQAESMLAARG